MYIRTDDSIGAVTMKSRFQLHQGDNREVLKTFADNSMDSIVCDPPYELAFMGKRWDNTGIAYDATLWAECLRVLKPGGHLIAFGGTRTYHRMTVAIEDAGFEIRDCIMWMYGSGFPKSLDVSKAIDKQAGAERSEGARTWQGGKRSGGIVKDDETERTSERTIYDAPATPEAQQWHGYGTALKPAVEPAVLARKPLSGTVADNVLTWGVGAINIDGCRVGSEGGGTHCTNRDENGKCMGHKNAGRSTSGETFHADEHTSPLGRWPANVLLDEDAAEALDAQSGEVGGHSLIFRSRQFKGWQKIGELENCKPQGHSDSGGASRFFYTAKASRAEREAGLYGTCTVKYNIDKSILGGLSWKDVSTVAVQLLQKVTSDLETLKWLIDESGENITALFPSDSSFITSMEISRTTALKTCNSLMHLLTSESTADANCEMESGSSHAKSVESLRAWILSTTNAKMELAHGAVNVALTTLQQISKKEPQQRNNSHSTVKPIALMRYLVRLVTPKGGVVLDPFMGSGSTGCAAMLEGIRFVGIDLTPEYVEIAERRIQHWMSQNPMEL